MSLPGLHWDAGNLRPPLHSQIDANAVIRKLTASVRPFRVSLQLRFPASFGPLQGLSCSFAYADLPPPLGAIIPPTKARSSTLHGIPCGISLRDTISGSDSRSFKSWPVSPMHKQRTGLIAAACQRRWMIPPTCSFPGFVAKPPKRSVQSWR
jgi:hypothetical protein